MPPGAPRRNQLTFPGNTSAGVVGWVPAKLSQRSCLSLGCRQDKVSALSMWEAGNSQLSRAKQPDWKEVSESQQQDAGSWRKRTCLFPEGGLALLPDFSVRGSLPGLELWPGLKVPGIQMAGGREG